MKVTTTGQTVIKSTTDMGNIKYNKELNTPDWILIFTLILILYSFKSSFDG